MAGSSEFVDPIRELPDARKEPRHRIALGREPLPVAYFTWLLAVRAAYCVLSQLMKGWYIRRFREWL